MKGYDNDDRHVAPKGARMAFGIIMVLVYVGVGLLFIFNVFDIISYTVKPALSGLFLLYMEYSAHTGFTKA